MNNLFFTLLLSLTITNIAKAESIRQIINSGKKIEMIYRGKIKIISPDSQSNLKMSGTHKTSYKTTVTTIQEIPFWPDKEVTTEVDKEVHYDCFLTVQNKLDDGNFSLSDGDSVELTEMRMNPSYNENDVDTLAFGQKEEDPVALSIHIVSDQDQDISGYGISRWFGKRYVMPVDLTLDELRNVCAPIEFEVLTEIPSFKYRLQESELPTFRIEKEFDHL